LLDGAHPGLVQMLRGPIEEPNQLSSEMLTSQPGRAPSPAASPEKITS
jgi:hypothetical protein